MLNRCVALSKMYTSITATVQKREDKLQRRLTRLSAPICASPWGVASHAARKLVDAKRRDAERAKGEQTVLVLAELKSIRETSIRLETIRGRLEELEPNSCLFFLPVLLQSFLLQMPR